MYISADQSYYLNLNFISAGLEHMRLRDIEARIQFANQTRLARIE